MRVKRIVANIATDDIEALSAFYQTIFDLDVLMMFDWIATLGNDNPATPQISFATQGGSGTNVPRLSIEVDDLETVLQRALAAGCEISYGPVDEPWGVRRFNIEDPSGNLLNILQHL